MHPYDGAIAYEDSVVGKLLQELKARGLYDGVMIAVMADHGESLGAHGEDTHGIFLYDETIQVPLVIKPPAGAAGGLSAGKRIENRVELVDVLPTMLQAAGVEVPGEVQGQSLLGSSRQVRRLRATGGRGFPARLVGDNRRRITLTLRMDGARCNPCARENICTCSSAVLGPYY